MRTWTRRHLLFSAAATAGLAATASPPAGAVTGKPRVTDGSDDTLVRRLRALPGVRIVEERQDAEPGYRHFVLGLRQPVDNTNPAAGTFEQRLTLLHTSAERPTVLFTTGYEAVLTPRRTEPAILLGGNQLQVEHRYFGTSLPRPHDYAYLTVRQAADDHHRVVRTFRRLYPGAWISTGGSKGGMASVYHRRFHPHDVDGTVAYAAPNNVDDRDDSAYLRFLNTVGTAADREALATVQRRLLLHRTELVARYETATTAAGDTFRIVGSADKAFEIAVLRAPFMFWQNGGSPADLAAVPAADASTDELYTWLDRTAGLALYADNNARAFIPYWYQLGTQLGYLDVPTAHLADLLRHPDAIEPRTFVPRTVPMRFDTGAMPDIDRWVRRSGSRLLFVNGTRDPSVAEPFHPGPHDSRVLWVPGANHHTTIAALPETTRTEATTMLTRWTSHGMRTPGP
jgi:hypothetical protein